MSLKQALIPKSPKIAVKRPAIWDWPKFVKKIVRPKKTVALREDN
jgi:hypothetical protein